MPQLDFNIAFSNFVYLIFFFFIFYLFSTYFFLPQLFKIFAIHMFLKKKLINHQLILDHYVNFVASSLEKEVSKIISFMKL